MGGARSPPTAIETFGGRPEPPSSLANARDRHHAAHAQSRLVGVAEEMRLVGEDEQLREMVDLARSLEAPHHAEVLLVTIEIRHEDDALLVEARRVTEQVA